MKDQRNPCWRIVIVGLAVLLGVTISSSANTFGINAHIPDAAVLDRVAQAGIGWVRIDFIWSVVEPEQDVYTWDRYDPVISEIKSRGLKILANFHGTPEWATSGSVFSGVPDDPRQVQEILYLAARRYRGQIDAWGLWNEPNLERFWEGTRSDYIQTILLPASAGIRAADAGALVTAPDTAHLSSGHWDDWLGGVIRDGGDAIDVLTHHIYPSEGRASEVTNDLIQGPRFPWEDPSVRQVLDNAGWSRRPFWLTETGSQSVEHGPIAQADFYDHLLDDCFGPNPEADWVDRLFFYEIHDPPHPTPWSFGILWSYPDLVRKASFFTYREFIDTALVDDAESTGIDFPDDVDPGVTLDIQVSFRNTGTTVWRRSEDYGLHIETDDFWWWTAEPSETNFADEVHPGDTVELLFQTRPPQFTSSSQRSVASFVVRVADGDGRPFGNPARVTIVSSPLDRAEILTQPRPAMVAEGARVKFSLLVEGSGELEFQWRRNSVELADDDRISGSRTPRLKITGVDSHQVGDYDCVVRNSAGQIVSEPAALTLRDDSFRRADSLDRRRPSATAGAKTRLSPFFD